MERKKCSRGWRKFRNRIRVNLQIPREWDLRLRFGQGHQQAIRKYPHIFFNFLLREVYYTANPKDFCAFPQELKNEEHGKYLTILQANVTVEAEVERCAKWLSENVTEINIYLHSVGIVGNNNLIGAYFRSFDKKLT